MSGDGTLLNSPGFGRYGARILFPLSSAFLLTISERLSYEDEGHLTENQVVTVTTDMVDLYNAILMTHSHEQVYGASRDVLDRAVERLKQLSEKDS